MPRDIDIFPIPVVLPDVPVDPDDRRPDLVDDVGDPDIGTQIIISQNHGRAGCYHRTCNMTVVRLTDFPGTPVSTVNENVHRSAFLLCREDVQHLPRRPAIGDISHAGQIPACPRTALSRFAYILIDIFDREPRQILKVDIFNLGRGQFLSSHGFSPGLRSTRIVLQFTLD